MGPRAKAAVFFGLGVGMLVAMLVYVGPHQLARALSEASPLYLVLAFAAYGVFFVLRGLRWKVLFSQSAPDVRVSSTTSTTAVGWLANSILPFKTGDLLRAALLARREKVGLATSAATVGLERVLDLMGLALMAALALRLLPRAAHLPPGLERAVAIAWALPIVALAILVCLVRFRAPTVRLARRVFRPLGKLGERLADFGDTVLAGLHALGRKPVLLAKLAPLTILVAASQALIFTFLVMAFLPATPIVLAYVGSSLFLLSFVVSITPGNVGTYEAAFFAIFVGLGASPDAAVPASILTHAATTIIVAVLGGLGLASLGAQKKPVPWTAAPPAQGGSAR